MTRPGPTHEALVLPGMQAPIPVANLLARRAFGPVLSTGYWGVDPAKFNEVTPADEALVDPNNLRRNLYDDSKHSIRGVVFTPNEFAEVPLSVSAFAKRVGARALRKQQPLKGKIEGEADVDIRAAAHAFEKEIPKLETLVRGYEQVREQMTWVRKAVPYHWHAHMKDSDMRVRVVGVRTEFQMLIDSVAASEEWSVEKLEAARTAHEKRLLMGRLDAKKAVWLGFAVLSTQVSLSKRAIVNNKITEMRRHIKLAA